MQTENEDEKPAEASPEKAAEAAAESSVQTELDELREEFAELKKTLTARAVKVADIDAAAGRREEPRLTKDALAKMSQAEIARLDWKEVRRVLSAG